MLKQGSIIVRLISPLLIVVYMALAIGSSTHELAHLKQACTQTSKAGHSSNSTDTTPTEKAASNCFFCTHGSSNATHFSITPVSFVAECTYQEYATCYTAAECNTSILVLSLRGPPSVI